MSAVYCSQGWVQKKNRITRSAPEVTTMSYCCSDWSDCFRHVFLPEIDPSWLLWAQIYLVFLPGSIETRRRLIRHRLYPRPAELICGGCCCFPAWIGLVFHNPRKKKKKVWFQVGCCQRVVGVRSSTTGEVLLCEPGFRFSSPAEPAVSGVLLQPELTFRHKHRYVPCSGTRILPNLNEGTLTERAGVTAAK